jgi:hypothetical protein
MKYVLCVAALALAAPAIADDVQLSDDAPWGQWYPAKSCPILQLITIDRFTSKTELDYKGDAEDHGVATWDGKALNIAIDGKPGETVRITWVDTGPTTGHNLLIERRWPDGGGQKMESCQFTSEGD